MSTPEYEIVPAVPGDLDALVGIESRCFGASVAISRRQFRYLLRAPVAGVYVLRASRTGQVVGDAIILRRRVKTGVAARLYSLAVAPEHRGRKFGKALLCHCLAELRQEGAMDATLEVAVDNAPAVTLYESLGFEKARRLANYYGPGQDGWRMKLKFV